MADGDESGNDQSAGKRRLKRPIPSPGAEERYYTLRVDRTTDPQDPILDYARLGNPSADAMYDQMTTIEEYASDAMTSDEKLDATLPGLGAAGEFDYTAGSRTRFVEGDDIERIAGDVYKVYGSYTEVILAPQAEGGGGGGGQSNRVSGTKQLTAFDQGFGTYYNLQRGASYSAKADMGISYDSNTKYDARISAQMTSSAAVKWELSLGTSLKEFKGKFSFLGYSAQIDGSGNFKSSNLVSVGKKSDTLASERIVLGIANQINTQTWSTLWQSLLLLANSVNAAFVATNIAALANQKDFEKDAKNLTPYLESMQSMAIIQASIALVVAIAGKVYDKNLSDEAANIKNEVGIPGIGRPFLSIKPDDGGTIELNTGGGASILLKEDKIVLNADAVQISAGGDPNASPSSGIDIVSSSGSMRIESDDSGGATFMATAGKAAIGGCGIEISSFQNGNIDSVGNRWTHSNEFAAAATTLGDTTATSVAINGMPVVPGVVAVPPMPTVTVQVANIYFVAPSLQSVTVLLDAL